MESDLNLQEIILKLDAKTVNYLSDDIRKKRLALSANSFSDKFLIRLVEALNKQDKIQVFKIRENAPVVKTYN